MHVVYFYISDVDIAVHEQQRFDGQSPVAAQAAVLGDTSIDTRYHAPAVSPTFRPMSGRSSVRPPTAAERRQFSQGANKDNGIYVKSFAFKLYILICTLPMLLHMKCKLSFISIRFAPQYLCVFLEFLRASTNTPLDGRPDSANSFSRYNVLPSISHKPLHSKQPLSQIPTVYRQPIHREVNVPYAQPQPLPPSLHPNTEQNALQSCAFQSGDATIIGHETKTPSDDNGTVHNLTLENLQLHDQVLSHDLPPPEPVPEYGTLAPDLNPLIPKANTGNDQMIADALPVNTMESEQVVNEEVPSAENIQPEFPPLTRQIHLPVEPNADEAEAILLAIKLPDGRRLQRYFLKSHTLKIVLNFAESSAQLDFTGTELVCDAPRKVFADLSLKICDTGLENRTVLHVQIPDEI